MGYNGLNIGEDGFVILDGEVEGGGGGLLLAEEKETEVGVG